MRPLLISFIILCVGTGFFCNFVVNKDEKDRPSFYHKLWLIPFLSSFIVLPILAGTLIYFIILKGTSTVFHSLLSFASFHVTVVTAFWIVVSLFICELLIHPSIHFVFRYSFQREHFHIQSLIRIMMDAVFIFIVMRVIPGVYMSSFSLHS